jgi:hypothetical protein
MLYHLINILIIAGGTIALMLFVALMEWAITLLVDTDDMSDDHTTRNDDYVTLERGAPIDVSRVGVEGTLDYMCVGYDNGRAVMFV